jgi:glycosyl transferase family 25
MDNLPRIFVINMAKDNDRMQTMSMQLESLNLQFERVDAVVGVNIQQDEKRATYSDFWFRFIIGRPAIDGEIGCYLSHKKIWKIMVERGIDLAIIMEDDTLVLDHFKEMLGQIEESTQNFDMVHLFSKHPPNVLVKSSASFDVMKFRDFHHSGACYALRLSGAEKLLRLKKIIVPVDIWPWLSVFTGLRCCGIIPFPVALNPKHHTQSTILKSTVSSHGKRSRFWKIFIRYPLQIFRVATLRVWGL